MGFGKADGYVPARIAYGKVEADWSTVVRYVADILGLTLDGLEVDWETVLTPTDLDTAIGGVVPAGTICAHRWRLAGTIDKQPIVAVQYFAAVSSAPWPSHWPDPGRLTGGMSFHISGRPGFRVDFEFDKAEIGDTVNPGVTATAMAVVNAIPPAVVAAAPGIIELPLSGPSIVTRRATPPVQPPQRPPENRSYIMVEAAARDVYYDPYDFDIDSDPYPYWKRLRDEAPLYHNEKFGFYASAATTTCSVNSTTGKPSGRARARSWISWSTTSRCLPASCSSKIRRSTTCTERCCRGCSLPPDG